ncbi:fungal-specific transcription factor domain-containing protein [Xylariales sp. PMI_506]|nr:fungal-specific transcription factor domain-containing protein [Xylariales sp. PMI_506]
MAPTVSSVEHSRRSKHAKTFTGCWTCRARKVKCDEARPICSQCTAKRLKCEGYQVRLRWMAPEPGSCTRGYKPSAPPLPRHKAQRSHIGFDTGSRTLAISEVEEILHSIDAFGGGGQPSPSHIVGKSLIISNFGVFDNLNTDPGHSRNPHQSASTEVDPVLTSTASVPSDQDDNRKSSSRTEYFRNPTSQHFWWESTDGLIVRSPSPSHMSKLEQFLLYHYSHRVVHLFCVIDNDKSPWKTIHLPRVLQSVGQLCVQGSSSTTRDALRNALLSISAFYLSNDSRSCSREEEAIRWANEAIRFQGRAIKLLKDTVEGHSSSRSSPKYKELLATMLSMITINVMSGDNSTGGIHLDGAFRFMKHATSWKSKYSPKARSLHRIYFYLRVIYESTAPWKRLEDGLGRRESPRAEARRLLSSSPSDVIPIVDATNSPTQSYTITPGTRMSTYEYIYGVPQSLLVLLARATDLISQVTDAREKAGAAYIPNHLMATCDELESSIVDWAAESSASEPLAQDDGVRSEIIQKTTLAFHNALIIYFAQHIRLIRYSYLCPHVLLVLRSIEAIEELKSQTYILAAPLYWPAFIASSEAFDKELQTGFKEWYTRVEPYGFASVRTGINVLAEVWRDGPSTENRLTSRWRAAVERTGLILMLS